MVAKLVKILALYMSGLAGPTVGLQEARVFAGNKVTRATRCPLAQKWVLSCTDNGGTSSGILGCERAWPFFPAGRFLSPSVGKSSLCRRGGHLFRHYRQAVNHLQPPPPPRLSDSSPLVVVPRVIHRVSLFVGRAAGKSSEKIEWFVREVLMVLPHIDVSSFPFCHRV